MTFTSLVPLNCLSCFWTFCIPIGLGGVNYPAPQVCNLVPSNLPSKFTYPIRDWIYKFMILSMNKNKFVLYYTNTQMQNIMNIFLLKLIPQHSLSHQLVSIIIHAPHLTNFKMIHWDHTSSFIFLKCLLDFVLEIALHFIVL